MLVLAVPSVSAQARAPADGAAQAENDDSFSHAALQISRQMAGVAGGARTVSLALRSLGPATGAQLEEARARLETAVRSAGLRIAGTQFDWEARFTLSRGLSGWLLAGELMRGGQREVFLTEFAELPGRAAPPAVGVALERARLIEQDAQVLDVLEVEAPEGGTAPRQAGARLIVLEPQRVAIYARRDARWQFEREERLPAAPPQRDLRGALEELSPGAVFARLPAWLCRVALDHAPGVSCSRATETNGPMPAGEAALGEGERRVTLRLAPGGALLLDSAGTILNTFSGWGSEMAAVRSSCGGEYVLASAGGDWTEPDRVQAWSIAGSEATPAGAAAEFAGPVMALRARSGGRAAVGVVKNLASGRYEAYRITIACAE